MSSQRFIQALRWMRDDDPRHRERGFDFLREHADSYVDALIAEFDQESDPELRDWLLELIAEARSPAAVDVLADQLDSEEESLRLWAIRGLEMLDTAPARQHLDRARVNGWLI
jgi:hypothetical protein